MSGKRFHIDRRSVLRAAGISGLAMALPPLEAMLEARGNYGTRIASAQAAIPTRLLFVQTGNGMPMLRWYPTTEGTMDGPVLDGLGTAKSKVCILSGLSNDHVLNTTGVEQNLHPVYMASAMNCAPPTKDSGGSNTVAAGATIDHVAASYVGVSSGLDPLVLACTTRNDPEGYISYSAAGVHAQHKTALDQLYTNYFLPLTDAEAQAQAQALKARRTGILGYLKGANSRLRSKLGTSDRAKLDQHLDAISRLESSLGFTATCDSVTAPDADVTNPSSNPLRIKRCKNVFEMTVMALKCGLARVATVQLTPSGAGTLFEGTGITTGEHDTSHNGEDDPEYVAVSKWKMERFAELLALLEATPEADGSSLLDHTVVVFFSEMSESSGHRSAQLPVLVAGKGIQGGRHVRFPCAGSSFIPDAESNKCTSGADTPVANLWLTAARAAGVSATQLASFANSTGTLAGLWA